MQYYFRYILGLKERPNLRLANGKAGHAAVEYNAIHKMKQGDDLPAEAILDRFSDAFDSETSELEPSDIGPDENLGRTKDETTETLRFFRHRHAPRSTPLAVEQEFTLVIPPTEDFEEPIKPIIGRIDIIQTRTEEHPLALPKTEVIDNKFVARMYNQNKVDMDEQPTMYDMVMTKAGMQTDNLGFQLFLPPNRKDGPRVIQLLRSPEYMTPAMRQARHVRLLYKLRTVAREIRLGLFKPVDNPIVCASCGFRERCQFSLVKSDYDALMIRQKNGEIA